MAKTFTKLTRPAIRKLPPGASITEHGINFERTANNDGVYTVNVMADGQRIHRVVGRESDGTTRTQAEDFIAGVRNDAKHDRLALPRGRKIALSFREAAAKYLDRLHQGDGKDIKMKASRLRLHLVPFFGDMPLSKISTFDLDRYKKHRQGESSARGGDRISSKAKGGTLAPREVPTRTSTGTINLELAVLSHLFNMAIEWGWIDRRPAKIGRFKSGTGRITYLTVEQAAALTECAKADTCPDVYPFILIALETSMRLMEILSIRREHVDVERQIIYIPKAKAGAREQPMTPHLAEFLKVHMVSLQPGVDWLFPSMGARSGHREGMEKPFRRVVVAAGLDPVEIVRHTLRHTAITHLVQAGVDLPTVKRISGHKTLAMVERYAHANGAHIQSAMGKLQARLRAA